MKSLLLGCMCPKLTNQIQCTLMQENASETRVWRKIALDADAEPDPLKKADKDVASLNCRKTQDKYNVSHLSIWHILWISERKPTFFACDNLFSRLLRHFAKNLPRKFSSKSKTTAKCSWSCGTGYDKMSAWNWRQIILEHAKLCPSSSGGSNSVYAEIVTKIKTPAHPR